ncbi:dihydroorotase [Caldichromatium japonicum]|uniref:Dihydroorotase n=1 Tax=Caldichromatium japonicum TaxID=2699430 RepID=A0A6G7VE84_9GAMM|nr:dihydroorotase [Caldichromatium japonicum]QIK38220.1 dihydroorotase [Caldichromatium japonicum]
MTTRNEIELIQPDDWHLHLRDGPELAAVVGFSARIFGRAIVMPNLRPPVTTTEQALAYRDRIRAALPSDSRFQPLMTLYLTDRTAPEEIERAKASGAVFACKLYPAGATTHADQGVTDIWRLQPVFEAMRAVEMPLLIHGEVVDPQVDIFDRESAFIEQVLRPLIKRVPGLKIVLEHVTTAEAVNAVRSGPETLAATITAHHLLYNRNAMLAGGIRPHFYCLPVLKRERHRLVLIEAVTSGDPRFFLGTDSAPHSRRAKEMACGCAGIFTAHAALELYAEVFEQAGALDRLEGFASRHGPDFYGLPRNLGRVCLRKEPWTVPSIYEFGDDRLIPLRANETIAWHSALCSPNRC